MRFAARASVTVFALLYFAGSPAAADHSVKLIDGLGNRHHSIATQNAETQKFFDQGLILTFAFSGDTLRQRTPPTGSRRA